MKIAALSELRREAHMPTIVAGLIHFEVSFAIWVLLGVLAPTIREDITVPAAATGLVIGVPFVASSFCRIVVGYLSDRLGPRRVGTVTMTSVAIPLLYGAWFADTLVELVVVSAMLGLAGASFAVALPLAASAVPPSRRGLALGIAGAGNSGTVIAGLFAPSLANEVGWRGVLFGAAMVALAATVVFRLLAKEAPRPERAKARGGFREVAGLDLARLCGLYLATFGTYVGLAAYLPTVFVDRYGATPVMAGVLAAVAAGLGSVTRPMGGGLADRVGGTRVVVFVLIAAAAFQGVMGVASSLLVGAVAASALLAVLGTGNGAVFQVVGTRFGSRVGLATGIVGAAGGLGGFLVPSILGALQARTGSYTLGFLVTGVLCLWAVVAVADVRIGWAFRTEEATDVA